MTTTKDAADLLLDVARGKHAMSPPNPNVNDEVLRTAKSSVWVENTQDAASGATAATGGKSARRTA